MIDFELDSTASHIAFDGVNYPVLNSSQRLELHVVAEKMNLEHESVGEAEQRFLTVSKKYGIPRGIHLVLVEYFHADTFFGLKGAMVDAVASKYERWLHPSVVAKRNQRDGAHHHITIISAASITKLTDTIDPPTLFAKLTSAVTDSWTDIGLGSVSAPITPSEAEQDTLAHQNSHPTLPPKAFFAIVDWPAASRFLEEVGAEPQTFHITLGFQLNDIHNVPKNIDTKIDESDLPSIAHLEAHSAPKKTKKATPNKSPKRAPTAKPTTPKQDDSTTNAAEKPEDKPSSSSDRAEEP